MTTPRLSLLHIEDDSFWQTAIANALRGAWKSAEVECAATGCGGLEMARTLRPSVILLDLQLPDTEGTRLAEELAQLPHEPRIVLLSVRQDPVSLHAACAPHIASLIWKNADTLGHLPAAITAVAAGGRYFPAEVRDAMRRFRSDPKAFFKLLTPRELELMPFFARGASDAEIAAACELSAHTVRAHRQNAMHKLDLPSFARLVHWAIVNGFGGSAVRGR